MIQPEGFEEPKLAEQIANGAYLTRTGSDKNLTVKFYYREEWDPISKEMIKKEMVSIHRPGDKSWRYDSYPTLDHKRRFAAEYALFKKGDNKQLGTPIEDWSYLQIRQLDELKYMGVETIEQIASMSEEQTKMLGFEGEELKAQAIAYCFSRQKNNLEAKLQEILSERDEKIKSLEEKIILLSDNKEIPTEQKQITKRGRPRKDKNKEGVN